MLASMSVAMPEQIEKSHSSSFQLSCPAQPSVFHSEHRRSARGSSDPPARWATLGFAKRWRTGHKDPLSASTQLAHVARQDHVLDADSPQRLQPMTTPSYSEHRDIPRLRPSLSHHAIEIKV
jgi:hypothetical protein